MLQKADKDYGEFELAESYFGAKRIKVKIARRVTCKTPVFGLLKRNGEVYVEIVKNCTKEQLIPIIQGKILKGSTINTAGMESI